MRKLLMVMDIMLNNNLQFCREELGMTQTELGNVFGIHKSTISGWENGYSVIPLKKLIAFCNLYNYSVDFVCGLSRKNNKDFKVALDKKLIGQRLREIRKKLGLTQQQIADECAVSQPTYNTYETGLYLARTMTIYTICKKHSISMDDILKSK